MNEQPLYRNISLSVRPPRLAVLVNKDDSQWGAHIEGIIQAFTQTWGGEGFIIIPTDGKSIDEPFWKLLRAYNPDKIGRYLPTLLDLEDAEPEQYQKIKNHYKDIWKLSEQDFEKTWDAQVDQNTIGTLEISKELSEQLIDRLSPFYHDKHVVSENIRRGQPVGFPFTRILDIVEYANDKPEKVAIPKAVQNRELRLLASSYTGSVTPSYVEELHGKGVPSETYPTDLGDYDYAAMLGKNEEDISFQRAVSIAAGGGGNEYAKPDLLKHLPYKLSMLELARYYRLDDHQEYNEGITVVVGSEIADYCLYYSMSRMHEGVYWLPDSFLKTTHSKHTKNKSRSDDEIEPYDEIEAFTASLVTDYFSKIGYGHDSKNVRITSCSLTKRQLMLRRKWIATVCWVGGTTEFLSHIGVESHQELTFKCVGRVLEKNNYANQQDIIFQDGKSVAKVNTPKPKNFTQINPADHRWITSLGIEGHQPPALPFLGKDIIELRGMSYETRVAVDGLAYLCPNIGYFGGDIDTNVVRPKLNMLTSTQMFERYFEYSGYGVELSDKGSYMKDTIERFGSLEAVANFFQSGANRNIFDQYLYDKEHAETNVVHLDTERRTYLSFEAFTQKLGSRTEAVEMIDDLIAKDVLRRGLIFQCHRCRRAAWYDVSIVSKEFKCSRCDLVQIFTHKNWKSPDEPRWYYHLVETVYLFYKSRSHATALALDWLRKQSKQSFHYICESDIKDFPKRGEKKEIDILAISDGQIIIGEVKDCVPQADDLSKYQLLLDNLKIKPDKFVLATTEKTISSSVKEKLSKMDNASVILEQDLFST